jgi:hypothetical protein
MLACRRHRLPLRFDIIAVLTCTGGLRRAAEGRAYVGALFVPVWACARRLSTSLTAITEPS